MPCTSEKNFSILEPLNKTDEVGVASVVDEQLTGLVGLCGGPLRMMTLDDHPLDSQL